MIFVGDIITTNYSHHGQTWRVTEVHRGCQCGRYRTWPHALHYGRQRLPHCHIVAVDVRGERSWWNDILERGGRLIASSRMWVRPEGKDDFQRIHPEIRLVARAEQGSLF